MKPTVKELSTYYNNFKKEGLIYFPYFFFTSLDFFDKLGLFEDGQIDFADFLNVIHAHLQNEAASDEVIKAFRVYDQNKTGFISIKELRAILTTTGEKLSNRDGNFPLPSNLYHLFIIHFVCLFQVDMILQEVNTTKDGKVRYEDIAKVLSTPIADY